MVVKNSSLGASLRHQADASDTKPGKIDDSALSLEHIFVPITPIMFKEGIGEINDAWPARQLR